MQGSTAKFNPMSIQQFDKADAEPRSAVRLCSKLLGSSVPPPRPQPPQPGAGSLGCHIPAKIELCYITSLCWQRPIALYIVWQEWVASLLKFTMVKVYGHA